MKRDLEFELAIPTSKPADFPPRLLEQALQRE